MKMFQTTNESPVFHLGLFVFIRGSSVSVGHAGPFAAVILKSR